MAVLGLLLIVVVALAVLAAVFRGGDDVRIDLEWFTIKTDSGVVFFAGVGATLLLLLGIWLVIGGAKRSRRRRAEVKGLRKRAEAGDRAGQDTQASPTTDTQPKPGADDHFDSAPREGGTS